MLQEGHGARRSEAALPRGRAAIAAAARRHIEGLRDDLRFSLEWVAQPRSVGAIAPSGKYLARAMAAQVDPSLPGPIVELGPGTGTITQALIARGVAEERLILIEANPDFARMMARRYPRATVICGDAFDVANLVRTYASAPVAAVISGLPLFNWPMLRRLRLLAQALALIGSHGSFIQFSYHVLPPVPEKCGSFRVNGLPRVWRNLFPARVWIYRPAGE